MRFVIANGDEGDPGSFIDRALHGGGPARGARGPRDLRLRGRRASDGIVFIRSEYPRAHERVETAFARRARAGILGERALGSDFAFDVTVFPRHGQLRVRRGDGDAERDRGPSRRGAPAPAVPGESRGSHGKPTVIDNVETLVNVAVDHAPRAPRHSRRSARRVARHEGAVLEPRLRAPGDRRGRVRHVAPRRSSKKPAAAGATGSRWPPCCSAARWAACLLPPSVGRADLLRGDGAARHPARSRRHRRRPERHRLRGAPAPLARLHARRILRQMRALRDRLAPRRGSREKPPPRRCARAASPSLRCDARRQLVRVRAAPAGARSRADRALRRSDLREPTDETA